MKKLIANVLVILGIFAILVSMPHTSHAVSKADFRNAKITKKCEAIVSVKGNKAYSKTMKKGAKVRIIPGKVMKVKTGMIVKGKRRTMTISVYGGSIQSGKVWIAALIPCNSVKIAK